MRVFFLRGYSSAGRALEWHSRGQRFDPAYLHFLKFKGVFMLSMSKLRDNSKWVLWTLLFFFVASMTVGGLVGGANILGTIQSFFGKVDTTLYVGKIGNESIPISYFLNERQIQLNRFRQQGRNIDSRAEQNASDFAWNNIIERKIKDEKINELNMVVQPDEVYNFLLLSPPLAFQNNLKELGLFKDEEGNFDLDSYQYSVSNKGIPDTARNLLLTWENYLKTFLADRKLQSFFNNLNSISDYEIKNDYKLNNINCTIDILNIKVNDVSDSLITISDDEILDQYNNDKEEKYKNEESITLQYIQFENLNSTTDLDSLQIIDLQDSLLQLSIDFSSDAQMTSFEEAIQDYDITKIDTIKVTEDFKNNSGLPFQMGAVRQAIRFAFDNNYGDTSDSFQTDNGLAVFNILGKNKSYYTDLEELKGSIERSLKRKHKQDYSYELLSNTDYESKDWKELAENNELISFSNNISSSMGGSFQTIGRNNSLISHLNSMDNNEFSKIIKSSSNVFVVKLITKDKFNDDNFAVILDSLRTESSLKARNKVYNQWLNSKKDNLEVIDLRSKIF
tara:strand:+ start:22774 stop:24462 length:1689 start_codon:yes stop_codon:yes gene_type:complete